MTRVDGASSDLNFPNAAPLSTSRPMPAETLPRNAVQSYRTSWNWSVKKEIPAKMEIPGNPG